MKGNCKIFKGGTLIDGNGGGPVENAVVVIKDDRIEEVGTAESITIPEGAEKIDTTGKTIIPGMIDTHLHMIAGEAQGVMTGIPCGS